MTQAARQLTFEEYISLEDSDGLPERRCEFVDGELVELPPESGSNDAIANYLFLMLVNAGVPFNLVRPHTFSYWLCTSDRSTKCFQCF